MKSPVLQRECLLLRKRN